MSVWVEIKYNCRSCTRGIVTLHVSVWVEIDKSYLYFLPRMSRSTWACELKSFNCILLVLIKCHAPRERVSWNKQTTNGTAVLSVTLHVSVWVEITMSRWWGLSAVCHAPRERVSWNVNAELLVTAYISHAPRERVSWNEYSDSKGKTEKGSRSTWACELKLQFRQI